MLQLDPPNNCGWRHDKPGRVCMWEGVMLRLLGPRWKEALLADDLSAEKENDSVESDLLMVGRSATAMRTPRATEVAGIATDDIGESRARTRPRQTTTAGAGLEVIRFAPTPANDVEGKARLVTATDCANMASWVNGMWRAFNPRFHAPLRTALQCIKDLRRVGARPPSDSSDWLMHIAREHNIDTDRGRRAKEPTDAPWNSISPGQPSSRCGSTEEYRPPELRAADGCCGAERRAERVQSGRGWRRDHGPHRLM